MGAWSDQALRVGSNDRLAINFPKQNQKLFVQSRIESLDLGRGSQRRLATDEALCGWLNTLVVNYGERFTTGLVPTLKRPTEQLLEAFGAVEGGQGVDKCAPGIEVERVLNSLN